MSRTLLIVIVLAALAAALAACTTAAAAPPEGQPDLAATQAALEKTQTAVAASQSALQKTQTALEQQVGAQAEGAPAGSEAAQAAPAEPNEAEEGSESETTLIDVVVQQTRQFKGEVDAPVKLVMFSDFQWPYCGKFATGAGRQINEKYVDTGKVQFGYFHFIIFGQPSQLIGEASECAGAQGAFWPYYEALFQANRPGESELKQIAVDLGLDKTAFDACLDEHEYASIVASQTQFAQQIGVQSAPSFLVNNQPVIGAQPYEAFEQYIEQELAN